MPPFASPSAPVAQSDFDRGMHHFARQKFEEAMQSFEAALAARPDDIETKFQIGRVLLETLRAKDAIAWFKDVADQKPDDAKVWMAWAEAVALGGNKRDRSEYISAIKSAPLPKPRITTLVDRFGARRKGSKPQSGGASPKEIQTLIAALESGALDKAESMAKALLLKAPRAAVVANILGEVRARKGDLGGAISAIERAIKLDAGYTEAYVALGQLYFRQDEWVKAAKILRLGVMLSPDSKAALVGLGTALIRAEHLKPGIEYLQRAVALDGKDPVVWSELAHALLRPDETLQAIEAFEKAIKFQKVPASAALRVRYASALENGGRDADALRILDEVLASEPDHIGATMAKAWMLQSQGEFDAAGDLFRAAIEKDSTSGEAYWQLVMGKKLAKDDPLIGDMEQIYKRDDLPAKDRIHLGFALSKAMSDTGNDDQVFRYLDAAKFMMREMSTVSRDSLFNEMKAFRDAYAATDFKAMQPAQAGPVAPVFVTGMPRSGTTLVEQIISSHSSVTACGELGFTRLYASGLLKQSPDSDRTMVSGEALAQFGRNYTSAIQTRFPGVARFTDKSIFTFQHIGPLKRALPNARIIVVRRDPRDNLLSIYKNKFKEGTHGYANDQVTLAKFYDEFDKTIAFWRERVPDWFYEISYDALVANPEEETRKLIEACGLDWEDACLDFHNTRTKVKTLSVYQVRQPINTASVKGWKRFEKDLQPMIDQLRKDGHVTD